MSLRIMRPHPKAVNFTATGLWVLTMLVLAVGAYPASGQTVTINFETLPDGTIVNGLLESGCPFPGQEITAAVNLRYRSVGAVFSSIPAFGEVFCGTEGGPVITEGTPGADGTTEGRVNAFSPPNFLVGNPNSFASIVVDFVDPADGVSPAVVTGRINVTIVSIGVNPHVIKVLDPNGVLIANLTVPFIGGSNGFGNHTPFSFDVVNARRLVFQVGSDTQIATGTVDRGDGHGIDDLSFPRPVSAIPVANAGADQTANEGVSVSLQGSGFSASGIPLTFQWTQVAGLPIVLSDPTSPTPTFTAPLVTANTTLTFQLVVSNGFFQSAPDVVNITVANVNHRPVAETSGSDQTVQEGSPVMLQGGASFDPDGDTVSFQWTQVAGPTVTLSNATSPTPTFSAPLVTATSILAFQLVVSDGQFQSEPALATVVVENVNHAPIADTTGSTQTVNEGTLVTLNGGQSRDPDSDQLTFQWKQVGGPIVTLSNATSPTPTFTAPQVTTTTLLEFELLVSDGQLTSEPVRATVTVLNVNRPVACGSAAPSVAVLWPPNHTLIAAGIAGVTDPDNDQVTITITQVTQDEPVNGLGDGDTSPDAVIKGSTVLLRAERSGTGNGRVYHVHFTADDGQGGACTGSVKVGVPKSMRPGLPIIDDGQLYDSTQP